VVGQVWGGLAGQAVDPGAFQLLVLVGCLCLQGQEVDQGAIHLRLLVLVYLWLLQVALVEG